MPRTPLQQWIRAKLDESKNPRHMPGYIGKNRKFKPVKAVKPGAEFRRKAKKTDPLKVLRKIL
jgi:hypothetical protein